MKFPYKHVAFDVETTDVDTHLGEIIQIGALILNEDLSIGETFMRYIKPYTTHRNPKAMEVNKITEAQLEGAQTMAIVLPMFEKFAMQAGKRPVLSAWASYFDVPFLKEAYAVEARDFPFSYKNLDLKAIAQWEAAQRELVLDPATGSGIAGYLAALGLTFEGTAHDGLDDIKNSIRILKEFDYQSECDI